MSNKVGRNQPCPCGSGLKYKKCCMLNIGQAKSDHNFSLSQILNILKAGLEKESANSSDSSKKFKIKSLNIMNNNTLVCEFYPYSNDTIDLKNEIAFIMSFLSSFCEENDLIPSEIDNFAVRAYSEKDEEIMYALSSKEATRYIAKGKPVEWLKNTIFQDNSDEYRLSFAKKKISEIENSLRKIICEHLFHLSGNRWWTIHVEKRIRKNAEKAYENQKGISSSQGEDLISFTYLLNLKDIIVSNWDSFKNIFPSQSEFIDCIEKVNSIRRDEAHNRVITHEKIRELENLYSYVISKIANKHPALVQSYLIDNWRIQIQKIVENYSNNFPKFEIKKYGFTEIIEDLKHRILQIEDVLIKLESIIIPPGKEIIHSELINIFKNMKEAFANMAQNANDRDFEAFQESAKRHAEINEQIPSFLEKYLKSEL